MEADSKGPKLKLLKEYGRRLRLDEDAEEKLMVAAKSLGWGDRSFEVIPRYRESRKGHRNEEPARPYQMQIENLDWKNRTIFVPDSKTPDGRRMVPMSDRVSRDLLRKRVAAPSVKDGCLHPAREMRSPYGHGASFSAGS